MLRGGSTIQKPEMIFPALKACKLLDLELEWSVSVSEEQALTQLSPHSLECGRWPGPL